ncbi:Na(+)/H(+) antiporter subunit B [Geovibrio sp. ADMFC3]|jgi:multicomponent Na+:H+ antiporter subunit B|nr:sodium:proton antiporter [Deferribacteraceae bacterium]
MKNDVILRTVARCMVPFILLFAFYVQAHGEISPGGGFQAGVIFASAFILIALAVGKEKAREKFKQKISDFTCSLGLMIYAGIGFITILFGGLFLEYGKLPFGSAEKGNHLGMIGIELGVGIAVASVMVTIFFEIARKEDD